MPILNRAGVKPDEHAKRLVLHPDRLERNNSGCAPAQEQPVIGNSIIRALSCNKSKLK